MEGIYLHFHAMLFCAGLCFPLSKLKVFPACSALSFLPPTFTTTLSSSLPSLPLISLFSCVDYLWRLISSPLVIPHTFTINPHIYTLYLLLRVLLSLPLFSQVLSSPLILCIPCVYLLSHHPFILFSVERALWPHVSHSLNGSTIT